MMILLIINQKNYHQANNQKKKMKKLTKVFWKSFRRWKKWKKKLCNKRNENISHVDGKKSIYEQ